MQSNSWSLQFLKSSLFECFASNCGLGAIESSTWNNFRKSFVIRKKNFFWMVCVWMVWHRCPLTKFIKIYKLFSNFFHERGLWKTIWKSTVLSEIIMTDCHFVILMHFEISISVRLGNSSAWDCSILLKNCLIFPPFFH